MINAVVVSVILGISTLSYSCEEPEPVSEKDVEYMLERLEKLMEIRDRIEKIKKKEEEKEDG